MTAAADRDCFVLHQHALHLARSVLDRHEGIVDESRIVLVLGGITHNQGELRHHIFQIVYQKGGETIDGLELPHATSIYNWEDNDLLKTAGRQAASHITQKKTTEALTSARPGQHHETKQAV